MLIRMSSPRQRRAAIAPVARQWFTKVLSAASRPYTRNAIRYVVR
jgi:hypothetical protein